MPRQQSPPFPPLGRPEFLIGIVAAAETDLAWLVDLEDMLDHAHRQEGAGGEIVVALIVGKLEERRAAAPEYPELSRHGPPVEMQDAEPKRADRRAGEDQIGHEARIGF